jgi:hypothetical protein
LQACRRLAKARRDRGRTAARPVRGAPRARRADRRPRPRPQGYTPEDEEDSAVATVSAVWVYQARYRIPLTKAPAGNWVLLEGLDATITKTATLVPEFLAGDAHIFRPLAFQTQAVVKIAVEPLNPSELPKMARAPFWPIWPVWFIWLMPFGRWPCDRRSCRRAVPPQRLPAGSARAGAVRRAPGPAA